MKLYAFTRLVLGSASVVTIAVAAPPVLAQARAPAPATAVSDPLLSGFQDPGDVARPRVWWHWMNGNITWDGAKKDMDWMRRVGLAGLQAFDAGQATLQVVDKRLTYMSDDWKAVFRQVADYADKQNLELATAASPGWSETGGPWVTAADGMKKMAWSETRVSGGRPFTGKLTEPPKTSGMFQTSIEGGILGGRAAGQTPPELYVDQKVIAFPIPADSALPKATITSSAGPLDAAAATALSDGDLRTKGFDLPAAKETGGVSWVQWDYGKAVTVRGLSISTPLAAAWYDGLTPEFRNGAPAVDLRLEVSDDGQAWRDTGAKVQPGLAQRTVSVDSARGRYFRLVSTRLAPPPQRPVRRFSRPQGAPPDLITLRELVLHGEPTIHSFEEKAGYTGNMQYLKLPTGSAGVTAPKLASVIDLTSKMRVDGSLDWTPPAGDWMVLRMGYSLTGAMNRPASPEATGLEVDKMDAPAVKRYMDHYLGMYRDATGGKLGEHGLRAMMFDSWEASYANWTPAILDDFKRLRGYDATPWLPALAGHVIDSPERSDAFLWDWRRTVMQLLKTNHYEQLSGMVHDAGMFRYGEAHEELISTIGDGMEMRQSSDVPMGAMWQTTTPGPREVPYVTDLTEAASVAHIYGQNLTAAEAMTGGPQFGSVPWDLKATADAILIAGVNRFVIHTSAHQPVDKGPGTTLGVGQFFTRNETWAEQARPWIDYISRSSFILQQGQAVSDVALFYGETGPAIASYRDNLPDVPDGYRFDFVNADVILNRLTPKDGALETASGMKYRVLALGVGAERLTLPVLQKLEALVRGGATVVGTRPLGSPSLSDDPAAVKTVLDTLWPGGPVAQVGAGRVVASARVADGLSTVGVTPDFGFAKPAADSEVLFIHRRLSDGDAYFLSNRKDRAETIEASFRVTGKTPELWDPATALTRPAAYRIEGGVTHVTVPLDRLGSTFVVFRKAAAQPSLTPPARIETRVAELAGPWTVKFQPERGAPAQATFPALADFRDNADLGIKYFSGIATYDREITAPKLAAGERLWLDLGQVSDLAEVWVGGKLAGTAWKPPYRVDVTDVVKPGKNAVQIKVVNKWVNRLIGDVQPGVTKKITFTAADGRVPDGADPAAFARSQRMPYAANAPLVPSGLIGPVTLVADKPK